jgi:hypothetical protein
MSPIADTVAIVRHKHVTVSSQEISELNAYRLLRKHRQQPEPNGLRAPSRRRQRDVRAHAAVGQSIAAEDGLGLAVGHIERALGAARTAAASGLDNVPA